MFLYDEMANSWVRTKSTIEYNGRKRLLRDLWIMFLVPLIFLPPPITISTVLFFGFLSLSFIDEKPYKDAVELDP